MHAMMSENVENSVERKIRAANYKSAFALFGDFSPSRQRSPSPLMAGLKHRLSETQADFVVSPFFQRFTRSGSQINGRERAI